MQLKGVIRSTFCCFKGVSRQAEQRLWNMGCLTWRHFQCLPKPVFSQRKHIDICHQIEEAEVALSQGLVDYFLNRLDGEHKARVYLDFHRSTGFLDIETTGLSMSDELTVITVYDGQETRAYVRNWNLSEFLRELGRFSLIVTFNGTRFDLPRLRKEFLVTLQVPHIDLAQVVRAMGFRGSLKECERSMGISLRTLNLDGSGAVELWHRYRKDDEKALEQLLTYSREDVLVLERILVKASNFSMSSYPVAWPSLPAGKVDRSRSQVL